MLNRLLMTFFTASCTMRKGIPSYKNIDRTMAPEENCPPTPKLTLTQTLTLTRGQYFITTELLQSLNISLPEKFYKIGSRIKHRVWEIWLFTENIRATLLKSCKYCQATLLKSHFGIGVLP